MYSKYTGIILKKHPLGEADELLTIYTREAGKMHAKSRSSRKIQSRLAGHLQTLNEVEFEVHARLPRTGSGQGALPTLISARLATLNNYLRADLKKFAWAQVGVETLYRLAVDSERNEEAYRALRGFLSALGEVAYEQILVRQFQLKALALHGYTFPAKTCLDCKNDLYREKRKIYISAESAGLLCPDCASRSDSSASLSVQDWQVICALLEDRPVAAVSREVEKLVEGFSEFVLERDIKSKSFINLIS